jgi:hypothetical protein
MNKREACFAAFSNSRGAALELSPRRNTVQDRAGRSEPPPSPPTPEEEPTGGEPRKPFDERVADILLRQQKQINHLRLVVDRDVVDIRDRLARAERVLDDRAKADHAVAKLRKSRP